MRTVIGVMGGAFVSDQVVADARELGQLIAENGWVLLNGGRDAGVMRASAEGASEAGGLVVGILPGDSAVGAAPCVDVAIPTGMGDARNAINVLASRVVVALSGGPGTISEIALALKSGREVVLLGFTLRGVFDSQYERGQLVDAQTPAGAIAVIRRLLDRGDR